ncbi:MAG: hypothetical protein ACRD4M_04750 [Candidatus Acidiferrales bacterium]
MAYLNYEDAYPGLQYLPSSRNWWAWFKGASPACVHVGSAGHWVATLIPDTLYLRGKRALRRDPARPEVTLCLDCLEGVAGPELAEYDGRVVAFEPHEGDFTQYFFVAREDFEAAGVAAEVVSAIESRLAQDAGKCRECSLRATWLWFSHEQVASLDQIDRVREAQGEKYCPRHGAEKFWETFAKMDKADIFYVKLPYGTAGAYVWI